MERYSRMLLHFVHTLARGFDAVETFLFSTTLTRVTKRLVRRGVDDVVPTLPRHRCRDWSGGTRIGEALGRFNLDWSRRVMGHAPIVLLISDGWDRGEPERLGREMARLQRSCHRLVWLNPLLGSPRYRPLTRGMQAALPWIDDFLPVHNLASLEVAGRAPQPPRRPPAGPPPAPPPGVRGGHGNRRPGRITPGTLGDHAGRRGPGRDRRHRPGRIAQSGVSLRPGYQPSRKRARPAARLASGRVDRRPGYPPGRNRRPPPGRISRRPRVNRHEHQRHLHLPRTRPGRLGLLVDIDAVAACLPGLESLEPAGDNRYPRGADHRHRRRHRRATRAPSNCRTSTRRTPTGSPSKAAARPASSTAAPPSPCARRTAGPR